MGEHMPTTMGIDVRRTNPTQGRILSLLEPAGGGLKPRFTTITGHTSPIPPSLGATSRRVVPEVDEKQTAPPGQAAWQLTGGARPVMTPG
jgi:hypothetical protein